MAQDLPVAVVAKASTRLPALSPATSVILEPEQLYHPLLGLITAIEHFGRVLAVACDMPFLTSELLAALAHEWDQQRAAAVTLDGRFAPFPSLHSDSELPSLRSSLDRRASLREAFAQAQVTVLPANALDRFGDPRQFLISVNTPAELQRSAAHIPPAPPR